MIVSYSKDHFILKCPDYSCLPLYAQADDNEKKIIDRLCVGIKVCHYAIALGGTLILLCDKGS